MIAWPCLWHGILGHTMLAHAKAADTPSNRTLQHGTTAQTIKSFVQSSLTWSRHRN